MTSEENTSRWMRTYLTMELKERMDNMPLFPGKDVSHLILFRGEGSAVLRFNIFLQLVPAHAWNGRDDLSTCFVSLKNFSLFRRYHSLCFGVYY